MLYRAVTVPFGRTHPYSTNEHYHTHYLSGVTNMLQIPFKLSHPANQTQDSSSTLSLTECTIIDLVTDAYQPPFDY